MRVWYLASPGCLATQRADGRALRRTTVALSLPFSSQLQTDRQPGRKSCGGEHVGIGGKLRGTGTVSDAMVLLPLSWKMHGSSQLLAAMTRLCAQTLKELRAGTPCSWQAVPAEHAKEQWKSCKSTLPGAGKETSYDPGLLFAAAAISRTCAPCFNHLVTAVKGLHLYLGQRLDWQDHGLYVCPYPHGTFTGQDL